MSRTARNIVANIAGRAWSALLSVAFVPVYVHFIGIEAYGVIGFVTTIEILFVVLDLGLSTTTTRELARAAIDKERAAESRDMMRTVEVLYWAFALLISAVVAIFAWPLARHWVHPLHLTSASVALAVATAGLGIALRFPFALYSGALQGLQRQVALNILVMTTGTARAVGTAAVLWLVSPTLEALLVWQTVVSLTQTTTAALLVWRFLPSASGRPAFRRSVISRIWRFSGAMSVITLASLPIMQSDKVLLSRLLPLDQFGYYSLASTIATSLFLIADPVGSAMFPRLAQLVAQGDLDALARSYHRSCQLMSFLILPVAAMGAVFAPEILELWTKSSEIAAHAHIVLSLLLLGTSLNCMIVMPYMLTLAVGWLRLPMVQYSLGAAIFTPSVWLSALYLGPIGPPILWIAINCGFIFISIPVLHSRMLQREKWKWYGRDVVLPFACAFGSALLYRQLLPVTSLHGVMLFVALAVGSLLVAASVATVTPLIRERLRVALAN